MFHKNKYSSFELYFNHHFNDTGGENRKCVFFAVFNFGKVCMFCVFFSVCFSSVYFLISGVIFLDLEKLHFFLLKIAHFESAFSQNLTNNIHQNLIKILKFAQSFLLNLHFFLHNLHFFADICCVNFNLFFC